MSTECNPAAVEFQALGRRKVVSRFDGGKISSDGGAPLLREVARASGLLDQFAACFQDHRDPRYLRHPLSQLVSQRVYGLALGYEDLNDHDELRHDPLLAVLVEKDDPEQPLAGKSTLNRLELTTDGKDPYKKIRVDPEKVNQFFTQMYVAAHPEAPEEVIVDLDATDDPVYGQQEGRFFHGYYRGYCYLPLYLFTDDGFPLCARLRPSNIDASEGSVEEVERIVVQLRSVWPNLRILVRGDSGFAREELMAWCEAHDVDYVFGLARNPRLQKKIQTALEQAAQQFAESGQPARCFEEFFHSTRHSWTRRRRVVAKAEHLAKGSNPRFVVTSLSSESVPAQFLYEQIYCARGDMENRIKEQQLALFADRTSSRTLQANQLRLWFSTTAYLLLHLLRRLGLKGTQWARAQCDTIRLRLLKIGAQIRFSVRRVVLSLSSAYPYQSTFAQVYSNLQRAGPAPRA